MRVPPTAIQPLVREYGKPAAGRGHAETNAASGPAPSAHAQGEHGGPKAAPPGLERVLARRQSVPEADRNAGQTMATSRISRNLDRYRETQALGQTPVTAPTPPAPEAASGTPPAPASEPMTANTAEVTPPVVPAPAEEVAAGTTVSGSTSA